MRPGDPVSGDVDAALIRALRAELGAAAVLTGDAVTGRSAGGWGPPRPLEATVLVRPADTAGVARVLAACQAARQPVVTHGGLTGLVDGAHATRGDLVLSLERLVGILDLDPVGRTLTVAAGTPLETVQQAAAAVDLMFPLDLGARGSATIGGNAATNAGGNRVLRYGMARESILGLEAVLADGTVISSLNTMLKNNAGYDLKQLFIGSEGTLGVITRLVLRLRPSPASQCTALASLADFEAVTALLDLADRELGGGLSAFEVMWRDFYDFVAGTAGPLPGGRPFYVLLEALGGDPAGDAARFEALLGRAFDRGLVDDAVVAQSEQQRLALWAVRDDVVRMLALEPMFLFDVSLPIRTMARYVVDLGAALEAAFADPLLYVFGHVGDGNLHLGISAGPADGAARGAVEALVYRPLAALGGSVSAEHGIGLEKKPWLALSRSLAEIELMRTLKRALDPHGLLNPGRIFDAG